MRVKERDRQIVRAVAECVMKLTKRGRPQLTECV